jgi:hypothetical protein
MLFQSEFVHFLESQHDMVPSRHSSIIELDHYRQDFQKYYCLTID